MQEERVSPSLLDASLLDASLLDDGTPVHSNEQQNSRITARRF